MADDPYSRLYHKLADEYPDIYDDPAALGTYVQLLIQADQSWPTAAFIPGLVTAQHLEPLVAAGLVTVDGKRYRVKGLEKDRKRRRSAARKGANARWNRDTADADAYALAHATAGANAYANGMPSRAEKSQEEPSKEETRRTARDRSRGLEPLSEFLGGVK